MAHHATSATSQKQCPEPDEETSAGLCANRCGFYGAAATGGMCSKCYKEHAVATTVPGAKATTSAFVAPAVVSTASPEKKAKTTVTVASSDDGAADPASVMSVKQPAAAANRCATCRKKVGLLGFRCRCDGTFCSVHRYSDKHDCGFDYKTAGQEQIAKHNPRVVADKIATRI